MLRIVRESCRCDDWSHVLVSTFMPAGWVSSVRFMPVDTLTLCCLDCKDDRASLAPENGMLLTVSSVWVWLFQQSAMLT